MSQTAYTQDPAVAIEGGLVDISYDKDILTAVADAAIPFGRFVVRAAAGAADDRPPRVDLPSATGEITGPLSMGFALCDVTTESESGWAADDVVRVLRSGRLWCVTEDAVTFGAQVFVRFASGGGGSALGTVRSDDDTATAVALPGATFRSIADAAGLVVVEFRP